MSSIPLRIDADLVNVARESAALMERTPTAQIEFWAKLGRVMEGVMAHDALVLVKGAARVQDLDALLEAASSPGGKELALAEIRRHRGPTYSTDASSPGSIIESMPDGAKRRGRFVNRRFVAEGTSGVP